ncbi:hypothetical protein UK23_36375 [Lentzea aerocolonigenes]|uniref:Uncharacterized protein n=1 Tax=Lentzea aerocolonigenes TaxID=68170 RepID=A0A0F0GMI9_LENAE|nr:hypothetical protein [Lentzea aerocolonigenes]KJK42633.1 hypothetical protein UK23_36375 [Lentzea aerocolonigenes]
MHTKFSRTVRTTAVALVLAAGGGIVLGTAPASAATSTTIDFELASRSPQKPAWDPSVRETEGAASRRCFGVYGFRTRDYKPEEINGFARGDGSWAWFIKWRCYSN